jgi:RNA polymerase sigma-70 factor, ECF subfamily
MRRRPARPLHSDMALPNLSFLFRSMDGDDDSRSSREGSHRRNRKSGADRHAGGDDAAEIALATRILASDTSAFDEVFHRYFPPLVTYVRRFVDSADVAEDLVQDALIHLWEMRETVRPNASIVPLLRTIVRRAALKRLRHLRTAERVHELLAASGEASDVLSSTPPTGLVTPLTGTHRDVVYAVRQALAALPPRTRLVAVMHWLDGLGRRDIATELGVSVRTVDAQLYQAAGKIRVVLQPYRGAIGNETG